MNQNHTIKVTFLGTGTSHGVPVITCKCPVCRSEDPRDNRLRTSVLIETQGKVFVIDTGPDFRLQMLREDVQQLDGIFFTHAHKDHVAGLDDIRAFNYVTKKPVDVYAEKRVQESLKREYAYVFADEKYPGIPQMELHTINDKPFIAKEIEIIPIRAYHYKLPILGFRIGDFSYITDANFIPPKDMEKLKGTKKLVINALRKKTHISHFSLGEALQVIEKIEPDKAYLIHLSHLMGLHRTVEEELPENVHIAYDGLKIEI